MLSRISLPSLTQDPSPAALRCAGGAGRGHGAAVALRGPVAGHAGHGEAPRFMKVY